MRRKLNVVGGGDGLGMILRVVKIGKWSDVDRTECDMTGFRVVLVEVMTRSRVWPSL